MDSNQPGYKGFKDYTPRFLKIYDPWVVGFMAPLVWKMGSEPGLDLYRKYMGRRHVDIGPGTGYFIARARPPTDTELTLLDANPHVLDHCARTLAAWAPVTVEANVLQPLPMKGPFDSAGLAHVIHCLPSPMAAKAPAIEHTAAVLADDGVLFGGTVLGLSADHSWAARTFLRLANLHGGFDNRCDDVDGLRAVLKASFHHVEVELPTPLGRILRGIAAPQSLLAPNPSLGGARYLCLWLSETAFQAHARVGVGGHLRRVAEPGRGCYLVERLGQPVVTLPYRSARSMAG